MKVAYICDGLCKCSNRPGCYKLGLPGMDECTHTFEEKHALYGVCDKPENEPERFTKIDLTDTETVYWEGEIIIRQ